jgi:exopolysaccharide biosynthesis polyprenyl glycosylphosphotransferase
MSPFQEVRGSELGFQAPTSLLSGSLIDDIRTVGKRYHGPMSGFFWARRYHRLVWVSDLAVICSVTLLGHAASGISTAEIVIAGNSIDYFPVSALIGGAWIGLLSVYRSRDKRVVGIGVDEFKRVFTATIMLLGLLAMTCAVFEISIARGYFALAIPAGGLGLIATRWSLRQWLANQRLRGHYLSKVVVLGSVGDVQYVINQLEKKSGPVYKVVGVALQGKDRPASLVVNGQALPVVSDIYSVVDAVTATGADAVIVAGQVEGGSRYIQELGWQLEESSTELILATGLTNVAGPRIHSRPLEGLPLMHVELPRYAGGKHALKRLLDVVLSALALVALAPVFAVLAVLIRLDSPGPVIFRQERIGRGGRTFMMLKFRSMVVTAEDDLAGLLGQNEGSGLLFKMRNDPRVTRTGQWLRRYSMDEFPQFWNVLLGHMSLVGPRPPLQREVDGYESHVHRRLYIKPGLTGMWQINGRSELNWQDSVRLDLYYVENWSIAGDIVILWRTAKQMFTPTGAY